MLVSPPPPVLASARVLEYAVVEGDVAYTGRQKVIVAGQMLGPVPRLAIGRELSGANILLLHCDAEWDVLATAHYGSVEEAKRLAENAYSGISAKWQAVSFTDAEVEAFLDEEDRGLICSFCGRHPHEVEKIITGHRGAAICEICIRALRDKP
jgi:ClpX C4-type zinc finger